MLKVCPLITLFTYIVRVTLGMVLFDGLTTHLDIYCEKELYVNITIAIMEKL